MEEFDKPCGSFDLYRLEYTNIINQNTGYILPVSIMNQLVNLREDSGNLFLEMLNETKCPSSNYTPLRMSLKWQQAEMLPMFYKRCGPAYATMDVTHKKFQVTHSWGRICDSAQRFGNMIVDIVTREPLLYSVGKVENCDPENDLPLHFPAPIKDYYDSHCRSDAISAGRPYSDRCTEIIEVPDSVTTYSIESFIHPSQVDDDNDTVRSHYAGVCFDCLDFAQAKGLFSNMSRTADSYPLSRISFLYLANSHVCDEIRTTVWQDGYDPWLYHFHVKKGDELVCQAEFKAFDPDDLFLMGD